MWLLCMSREQKNRQGNGTDTVIFHPRNSATPCKELTPAASLQTSPVGPLETQARAVSCPRRARSESGQQAPTHPYRRARYMAYLRVHSRAVVTYFSRSVLYLHRECSANYPLTSTHRIEHATMKCSFGWVCMGGSVRLCDLRHKRIVGVRVGK